MTDLAKLIETIDRLDAEATPGPWQWSDAHDDRDGGRTWSLIGGGGYGILSCDGEWNSPQRCNPNDADLIAVLRNNWPALRDRLREAERERDEWKLASSKNGDAMSGYQSRAIVAEQQLEGAKRERDAALASLAERQRAIDAAMSARRSGMNAGSIADILRPEATDAKLNEAGVTYTPTKPQPDQPDTGFGTHVVPEYKPSAQPEPSGDSIAKRVDALERLTQELASAHCATFPPDQRIVGLVKRLADPVLRCCLQLNNEYKARDFVGTHAERSLLCNAIDECQAIIAELSAAEARLFSMRLPFHPEAKRDA